MKKVKNLKSIHSISVEKQGQNSLYKLLPNTEIQYLLIT